MKTMQKKTPFCENKRKTQKKKGGKLCSTTQPQINNEYDKGRDFPQQGSPTRPYAKF